MKEGLGGIPFFKNAYSLVSLMENDENYVFFVILIYREIVW
jgi:hypothetical protein